MLTETQSLRGATEQQFSKYDVIGGGAGMASKIARVQKINPDTRFHFSISPRAYQGFSLQDPCELGAGIPFGSTGPATQGCSVYAGHWLYHAGTRLTSAISATATTIYVSDASRLAAGEYIVIYDAPAGSFKNAEHALVRSIDRSSVPHKVTLARRGFKSQARPHPQNAIVARHALGRGNHIENWGYNMSLNGPTDANGKTIAEVMADWLAANVSKSSKGSPSGVRVDGIYFDADRYFMGTDSYDTNNDLVVDNAISANGVNLWGEGLEDFFALVRRKFPNLTIVGGERLTRGFDTLNGTQMENWPVADGFDHTEPSYGHAGGNGGFDDMLQRYLIQHVFRSEPELYIENLSKITTKAYPYANTSPKGNAAFRLGFASTLLGDGYYGQQNYGPIIDPWFDEYAVNVTPGSSTYGHAIKSNPANEAAVRAHKGWLGKALGPFARIYSETAFAPNRSLLSNGGFENGAAGWTFQNAQASVVSNAAAEGSKSLYLARHQTYSATPSGAKLKGPAVSVTAGKQYTLVFAAKAAKMREVMVKVQGGRSTFLVPDQWVRIVHTFVADKTGPVSPEFLVGREDIPLWLDAMYLFEGNANVFMREYENGIVVVNGTPSSRTLDLGNTYMRIKGTGQDPVNNGAQVRNLTLPAYDAAILVRLDGSQVSPPPPPGGNEPPPPPPPPPPGGNPSCGAPSMTHAADRILYVWADSCTSGLWHARVKSNNAVQTFTGKITSNGAFSAVQGYKLEPSDILTSNANRINFGLTVGQNAEDGLQFRAGGNGEICLTPEQPAATQVRLGANATLVSKPVNIRTGAGCSTTTARISLGEPGYRNRNERATFLWEDAGTGQWHVRMINGGASGEGRFSGSITGSGIRNLAGFKLESDDVLNQSGSGGNVNYSFSIYGSSEDGFGFRATNAASTCFNPGAQHPLYLGANRVRVTGPINLATLARCN